MIAKEKMDKTNSAVEDEGEDQMSKEEKALTAKSNILYDKSDKSLDMGRFKATEYKFNKYIHLPKAESIERESLHEVRRNKMIDIFKGVTKKPRSNESERSVGSKNKCAERSVSNKRTCVERSVSSMSTCVESNLSKKEQEGFKSLKKRVSNNEIVVTETDKSRRFCVLTAQQYIDSGEKHIKNDCEINYEELHSIQKSVNDHGVWLRRIFGIGSNWGHEGRIGNSMTDKGEVVAPLYLLIKDHKGWSFEDGTPPPSRPVCSGNQGFNRHLSDIGACRACIRGVRY